MNLTIDIGNTRTKLALFEANSLIKTTIIDHGNKENNLTDFLEKHRGVKHIISSAVGASSQFFSSYSGAISVLNLDNNTALPIENLYGTPDTLGADRIANAVGAFHLTQSRNVLVIDMGTCITLDIITKDKQYLGGSISNGIQMRFKALNTFTENLPLIAHDFENYPDLIGRSTNESIRSGVINGVLSELCGMIDDYNKKFDPLTVVMTGGDAAFVEAALRDRIDSKKNEIFADPNLVHIGLNAILNFNVKHNSQ